MLRHDNPWFPYGDNSGKLKNKPTLLIQRKLFEMGILAFTPQLSSSSDRNSASADHISYKNKEYVIIEEKPFEDTLDSINVPYRKTIDNPSESTTQHTKMLSGILNPKRQQKDGRYTVIANTKRPEEVFVPVDLSLEDEQVGAYVYAWPSNKNDAITPCDFIIIPDTHRHYFDKHSDTDKKFGFDKLPGQSRNAYVLRGDSLYFIDKKDRTWEPIQLNESNRDELLKIVKLDADSNKGRPFTKGITHKLSDDQLSKITALTGHSAFTGFEQFVTAGCMFGSCLQGVDKDERRCSLMKHDIEFLDGQKFVSIDLDSDYLNPYEQMLWHQLKQTALLINRLAASDKPKKLLYHLPREYLVFGVGLFVQGRMSYEALDDFCNIVLEKQKEHTSKIKEIFGEYNIEVDIQSPFDNLFGQLEPQKDLAETILSRLGYRREDEIEPIPHADPKRKEKEAEKIHELVNRCLKLLQTNHYNDEHRKLWQDFIAQQSTISSAPEITGKKSTGIYSLEDLLKKANTRMIELVVKRGKKICTLYPLSEKQIPIDHAKMESQSAQSKTPMKQKTNSRTKPLSPKRIITSEKIFSSASGDLHKRTKERGLYQEDGCSKNNAPSKKGSVTEVVSAPKDKAAHATPRGNKNYFSQARMILDTLNIFADHPDRHHIHTKHQDENELEKELFASSPIPYPSKRRDSELDPKENGCESPTQVFEAQQEVNEDKYSSVFHITILDSVLAFDRNIQKAKGQLYYFFRDHSGVCKLIEDSLPTLYKNIALFSKGKPTHAIEETLWKEKAENNTKPTLRKSFTG